MDILDRHPYKPYQKKSLLVVSVMRNRSRLAGLPVLPDEIWLCHILAHLKEEETRVYTARVQMNRRFHLQYAPDMQARVNRWETNHFVLAYNYRPLTVFFSWASLISGHSYTPIRNRNQPWDLPRGYLFTGVPEWAQTEYKQSRVALNTDTNVDYGANKI